MLHTWWILNPGCDQLRMHDAAADYAVLDDRAAHCKTRKQLARLPDLIGNDQSHSTVQQQGCGLPSYYAVCYAAADIRCMLLLLLLLSSDNQPLLTMLLLQVSNC
jgi:hypothetical protein